MKFKIVKILVNSTADRDPTRGELLAAITINGRDGFMYAEAYESDDNPPGMDDDYDEDGASASARAEYKRAERDYKRGKLKAFAVAVGRTVNDAVTRVAIAETNAAPCWSSIDKDTAAWLLEQAIDAGEYM